MTESELLFTELLNCSRDKLYLDKDYTLTPREVCLTVDTLKRRLEGEPIQYILGRVEFMGLEFMVVPDVFIPRPETEILVETAIRFMQDIRSRKQEAGGRKILDVGTGSGCIAINLAKFLRDAKIYATDISKEALEIAKKNALLNNVEISFFRGNLFTSYPECCYSKKLCFGIPKRHKDIRDEPGARSYELIISNPPYIPTAEIENLGPELSYEPRIALDGGEDGLDFYRRLIKESSTYLKRNGFLILEIGFNQCSAIKKLFNSVGKFEIIEVVKDYNSIDRIIVARYG
jgi:release factor glutamine methyltransferase